MYISRQYENLSEMDFEDPESKKIESIEFFPPVRLGYS